MQPVARHGDPSSHGGTITGACSPTFKCDGIAVARTGDAHTCPIPGHGTTALTGSSEATADGGLRIVRVGDTAGCGAAITSGSPTVQSA
jgi:uncharacterized Zn-binding protein involved in type VI secretion